MTQVNHNDVVTHLELDILMCEVKWALGSTTTSKVSGGYRISAELLKILKDDAFKVLHSICQHICKTQQWATGQENVSFFPILKKSNAKVYSNYLAIALISHAFKVMLKILQVKLQQYMNQEISDVEAGFRKGR